MPPGRTYNFHSIDAARQKIGGSLTAAKLRADETQKSCNEIMGTHQNLTTSCDMKIEMCPLSFPRSPLECNSSEQLALKDFIVSMASWEGRSVCLSLFRAVARARVALKGFTVSIVSWGPVLLSPVSPRSFIFPLVPAPPLK